MTVLTERCVALALAVLGVASSCRPQETVDEHQVRAVVRAYNQALPAMYAQRDQEALAQFATRDEVDRLWTIILGLSQQGLVMQARQEEASVESVVVAAKADVAELLSTEAWSYRHVALADGRVTQAPRRVTYRLRYRLKQEEGRWRVDRLEDLAAEAERTQ